MEFHEKLQELRKSRGLTQEELAEALYVSRTAISKWESGRGYPSIDSLKEISNFFSVSLDDLLSSEKLLFIAEKENKSNLRNLSDMMMGLLDICSVLLVILPLYPNVQEGYVYSVNLLAYTQNNPTIRLFYWLFYCLLIGIGMIKCVCTKRRIEKGQKILSVLSIGISIFCVLFLALAREAYAIMVAFLLLVMKGILFLYKKPCA